MQPLHILEERLVVAFVLQFFDGANQGGILSEQLEVQVIHFRLAIAFDTYVGDRLFVGWIVAASLWINGEDL